MSNLQLIVAIFWYAQPSRVSRAD